MKLASLKTGGPDGTLIVVNRALSHYASAAEVAPTMQYAMDNWQEAEAGLRALSVSLESGDISDAAALDFRALASPFPRAYEFLDGSAYLPHVERVRKARGAEVPESFYSDPLMYQATSAGFLGPRDP
ncbi:MAG TPA: FAA hydrolase family protein, partial [Xanthomonadales bacterium]|nr:FAA hydrolase family protein [Xanthomonadales bacterium]